LPGDRFIELATSHERRVLDVLFRHASEAVTVQHQSGQLIYANDEAAALVGFASGEEMLSAPPTEVLAKFEMIDRSGQQLPHDRLPGRRVLAGEPFVEEVVGYRRLGSRQARWSRVHASPIKNDAGEVVMAINFFLDITEQIRREEGRRLLARAFEALGSSLDVQESLKVLAEVIVPQVGGWCAVHLVEGANLALVAAVYPEDGEAMTFVDVAGQQLLPLDSDRLQARVVATGQAELIANIPPAMLAEAGARDGTEFADLLSRLNMHSVACVPLRIRQRVIGTMTVARSFPDVEFDTSDVELLMTVAERAATTLENAKIYQQQHEIAETLQSGLLPKQLPVLPRLELATRYRPLEGQVGHVGGDFYDVVALSPTLTAVFVGDIAGKGVSAAAAVGLARHTLLSTVMLDHEPAVVFTSLNHALRREDPERMCTLAYLLVEEVGPHFRVRVALAGHPPPAFLRADGELGFVGRPCPPAGVLPSIEPIEEQTWLSVGDTVIVYTDGFNLGNEVPSESVIKAISEQRFETAEGTLDHMMNLLRAHPASIVDDVAMVALRVIS
jgi:PAS domain S-box-containing protein